MAPLTHHTTWRQVSGLLLIGVVVGLWTASSFLSSYMFADNTYSKPFLVTYINTSCFSLTLVPCLVRRLFAAWREPDVTIFQSFSPSRSNRAVHHGANVQAISETQRAGSDDACEAPTSSNSPLLGQSSHRRLSRDPAPSTWQKLTVRETLVLALKFCSFWFAANYFNAASFEHTSVASSTILVSSSSVFTLLLGAAVGVERFSVQKLGGVLACLGGVALISLLDSSHQGSAPDQGTFPHKSPQEIAYGDALALSSAIIYGFYAILLLKAVRDESRVNMPLFFGFVGIAALACFWPGVVLLDALHIERLEPPPNSAIWAALAINAVISVIADVAWGYAVLLTSPLVVTVGLSLTIPVSLVGQMIIHEQYASIWYWIGGAIVVLSFVFINHESRPRNVEEVVEG